ncbi:PKD domain-containing protein [Larkinella arboricola]
MKHSFTLWLLIILATVSTCTLAQTSSPAVFSHPASLLPAPQALQVMPSAATPTTIRSARQRAVAAIRYVKANGTGNGSSWSSASPNLQAMIDASSAGDQVWIAQGTFTPATGGLSNPRTASFRLKNGVGVLGGFAGTPGTEGNVAARTSNPSATILSGEIGTAEASDNCYHVINNENSNLDNTTILDGVVITRGYADGSNNDVNAGGINLIDGGSPTINNCLFSQNYALYGGALYALGNPGLSLTNCRFIGNSAGQSAGALAVNIQAVVTLVNCFFEQNTAAANGGAIINEDATINLTNCSLTNNQSPNGQALIASIGATTTLVNCLLWNNGGENAITLNGSAPPTASYSLFEPGETTFSDGGNNQTLTSSPFANPTGSELSACNSAIDAGNNQVNITVLTDVLGKPRRQRTIDIGAAEFQGTPSTPVAITTQPASGSTVCVGASVSVSLTATGTGPLLYQWLKDGQSLVPAQTTPTLNLNSVNDTDAGSYQVVVTGCGSLTSRAFTLSVNPLPNPTLNSSGPITCTNPVVTLTAGGGTSYSFSGPGIVSQDASAGTALVNAPGDYSVTVTSSSGCMSSTSITVGQDTEAPSLSLKPTSGTLTCTTPELTLAATSSASDWRWNTGEVTSSITVSVAGTYSVTATAANGCTATASVEVSENKQGPTVTLENNGPLLSGQSTVTLTATDIAGATYAFSSGTTPGSTPNTATVTTPGLYSVTVTTSGGCTATAQTTVEAQAGSVTGFELINTNTDQVIKTLSEGEVLNLATLPTSRLTIRANTTPTNVGSVVFSLSGSMTYSKTETSAPYSLFGDDNGNYDPWNLKIGSYSLRATPYLGAGGSGLMGTPMTLNFTLVSQANQLPVARAGADQTITLPTNSVVLNGSTSSDPEGGALSYLWTQRSGPNTANLSSPTSVSLTASNLAAGTYVFRLTVRDGAGATAFDELTVRVNPAPSAGPSVVGFTLMNADTDQPIRIITSGEELNLATLPRNLNIRANTNPATVGSVKMVLSGQQTRTQTETGAPYALFGDKDGDYNNWTPALGNYTLTGTAYTGASASGQAGPPLTVSFRVVRQAPLAKVSAESGTEEVLVYPNPFTESFRIKNAGLQPVSLYDLSGRKVFESDAVQDEQLIEPSSRLAPGLYLLQVGQGKATQHFKVIKTQ